MDTLRKAQKIAQYLETKYESKGHGGYQIYEDDKIAIYLDTYVPNTEVHVVNGGKKTMVMHYNGAHSRYQEYHMGKWEAYIDELYLKAVEAEKKHEIDTENRKKSAEENKYKKTQEAIDAVFS